jgi:MarR family transcriptional regulator, lower aerobic nicotinate degradation pathway regulator
MLELDKSSVVLIIDDLERLGLAERQPDPHDRRAHAVRITRRGRERARKADEIARRVGAAIFASLNPRDRLELDLMLWRIVRNCDSMTREKNVS